MILVERATEEDLPGVAACNAGEEPARLARDVAARTILIARAGAEVAGYARVDRGFFDQWFVWTLLVRPDWRRRGVASALLDYVERTRPADRLFTSTNESNAAARALLAGRGYAASGRIDNLDPGDPELVYVKWLEQA